MIKLSIIIVLYNEFDMVKNCISSVYRENVPNAEILLVDNSSDKLGYKSVLDKFPKIRYIQNKENVGFGRAVNVGIENSKGEFLLILTPDTYVLPNTIKETLSYIDKNKTVGLVACRIYSTPTKRELSATHKYPNLSFLLYYYNMPYYRIVRRVFKNYHPLYYSRADHNKILKPRYVMGAYMLIRKKALDKVGSFDPIFRLYIEDVDICKRFNDKKWEVVYLPIGGLVNGEGSPWKKTAITQALPEFMQSLYNFFIKHNGRIYAFFAWVLGSASALVSIPYLFIVGYSKKLFGLKSQSLTILPLWIGILKWHLTKGAGLIFKI